MGHEGAEDHDLARQYTRDVLTNHRILTTSQEHWDTATIVRNVSARPKGLVLGIGEFQGLLPRDVLGVGNTIPSVSGFFGDAISGKKLPKIISGCWAEAIERFVSRNHAYKGDLNIMPPDYDPTAMMPDKPLKGSNRILMDDQLDLCFRQEQRIRHFAGLPSLPTIRPYSDPRWVRSFLHVPTQKRIGQQQYRKFLARAFGRIFPDLQTKYAGNRSKKRILRTFSPKPRVATRKAGGYRRYHVDLDHLFQVSPSCRECFEENIGDLKRRGMVDWIDLDGLMSRLREGNGDYGRLAYILVSLEINLKADRVIMEPPMNAAPASA